MADQTAWNFAFPAINGGTLALEAFKGRVLLVTNTASFCGYTDHTPGCRSYTRRWGRRGSR